MAVRAEDIGVAKAHLNTRRMFALGVLAGAFIALGAVFATIVATGVSGVLPYGLSRLLIGLAFCLGLILVVIGGAELFTGNNLIVMAWASGKIRARAVLRNWVIVYIGNFVGAIGTAIMVFLSGGYASAGGASGLTALNIANGKMGHSFIEAVMLGILCNVLVCLAVWMSFSARSVADKVLAILFPITAFVAAGFEHSIANMYFIPAGLLIKDFAPADFWASIATRPAAFPALTWGNFLTENLLPVTIGNIIGGSLLVGGVYWFIYRWTANGESA
jgi:formate transporter FocA